MKPTTFARSTHYQPLNSNTIRKQMLKFADTAGTDKVAAHPYGDSVELSKLAEETRLAADCIAEVDNGFGQESKSVNELARGLDEKREYLESKTSQARKKQIRSWRNLGITVLLGVCAAKFGYSGLSGMFATPAVVDSFIPAMGQTLSMIGYSGIGLAGLVALAPSPDMPIFQSISKAGEARREAQQYQSKTSAFQTALKVLPAWVEMASKPAAG